MESNTTGSAPFPTNRYKNEPLIAGRRGRKFQYVEDQRLLAVLPKDVPERTWVEIFQKEEQDLMIFEIREEIIDNALDICYESYMERQSIAFTVHCVSKAWLKLVDWHFLRHDPGEDPSAYPLCDIPNRVESWVPDVMPVPCPKDSWAHEIIPVLEDPPRTLVRHASVESLDYPVVEPIAPEYWFPGKVEGFAAPAEFDEELDEQSRDLATGSASTMVIASEVLEKVTDYIVSAKESRADVGTEISRSLVLHAAGGVAGAAEGAGGDAAPATAHKGLPKKHKPLNKKKLEGVKSKSKISLPPIKSSRAELPRSLASTASDFRLRNLRVETLYEVSSEKFVSLEEKTAKKK